MGKRKFGVDNHIINKQFNFQDYGKYFKLFDEFSKLDTRPTLKDLISKELVNPDGRVTEGLHMFSDSYLDDDCMAVCRLWNGFDKGIDEVLDKKEIKGSLCDLFTGILNFIKLNTRTGFIKMKDGSRMDTFAYPEQALRESVVNALAHRDYSMQGTQIDIDIFKDRLTITSPGDWMHDKMPSEYPLDMIPSIRRNKIICNAFELLGLMEKSESGFKKI